MNAEHDIRGLSLPLLALRLRALVLALGESATPTWWKTEFMNETGLRFLERLYPRTSFRAAVYAVGKAACDVHDKAVGRVGVYHLFRLPEALETEMNRIPQHTDEVFIGLFRTALCHQDKLLELLVSLCNGAMDAETALGAKRIGTDKDLMTAANFEKMAELYHRAFAQGKPCFPYFAAEQNGGRGSL